MAGELLRKTGNGFLIAGRLALKVILTLLQALLSAAQLLLQLCTVILKLVLAILMIGRRR